MPEKSSLMRLLTRFALCGAAASLLLALIELSDINISLTPVFKTFGERLILAAYFNLNLLSGAVIGTLVGVCGLLTDKLSNLLAGVFGRGREPARQSTIIGLIVVTLTTALLLSLQSQAYGYVSGLLIEAQKLPYVYGKLLRFESVLVPVVLVAVLLACRGAWFLTAKTAHYPLARYSYRILVLGVIIVAYYVDSRYQVQLYEYTLHRSMFLLAQAAAMLLCASFYLSSPRILSWLWSITGTSARLIRAALISAVAGMVVFTFLHFGENQNLKVQLLTRTTQAKQHFKLAQWALDVDRDGYSAHLGGGDADDTRSKISPSQKEIPGDGLDNNQIAGDLTQQDIEEWFEARRTFHGQSSAEAGRLNVIYVFLDAARADHFGLYGYARDTTPNMDRLAAKSIVFENGFAPAANTFESAARFMKCSYWDAAIETWTEVLARNGYKVLLFPERRVSMLERYVKGAEVAPGSDGKYLKDSVDIAIDTLSKAGGGQPFCAYLYAVEPHMPYAPHKQFSFGDSLIDLYDGEIAFTDHQLGRLLDWMEQSGRINDTMIVVMSDHGESLGERAVYRHSSQLYNEQIRVPIIFYFPTFESRRIQDYVTTIDIGTTILDATGIPCPQNYAGVSLLPLIKGGHYKHPPIFAEQTLREKEFPNLSPDRYPQPELKKYMILTASGHKLIYFRDCQTFELFDVRNDPHELDNLYDYFPAVAADLKQQLGRFIDIVTALRPSNADERKYRFGDDRDSTE